MLLCSGRKVWLEKSHISVSKYQVNPQFYAFRWITLLLTQEFDFADSLRIWDTLVSDPDGPQVQIYSFLPCIVLGLRLSEKYLIISYLDCILRVILSDLDDLRISWQYKIWFEVVKLLLDGKYEAKDLALIK